MMLLAEAALRSFLLTAAAWLVLELCRVRNPHSRMAAFGAVLLASFFMPLLMRWAPAEALPMPALLQRDWDLPAAAAQSAAESTAKVESAGGLSWNVILLLLYLPVATLLTARLLLGLTRAWGQVRHATRISAHWTEGLDVRLCSDLAIPVTVGRAILLPIDFLGWNADRRHVVLAHEASHSARGDFYLLLLATLHRSLFWFNPAAWWLEGTLADLAEACSDAAALTVSADRLSYARTLIELAGRAHPMSAGVAMARRSTVRRRVEAILAAQLLPSRPATRKLVLIAAGMLPPILAAAGATPADALVHRRMADQARPRAAISLAPDVLAKFAGYYAIPSASELPLAVTFENGHLFAGLLGQPASEIFPESDHQFFTRDFPGQEDFQIGTAGRVTSVILHWNGAELPALRLDDKAARAVLTALADRIAANQPQPGSEAALRGHITQIQHGEIDDASLAYGMGASIRAMLPQLRPDMAALGPIIDMTFEGVGPDGMDIYRVTHSHGVRLWRIRLTREGRIESMWFTLPT